jgi:hypothetical protein
MPVSYQKLIFIKKEEAQALALIPLYLYNVLFGTLSRIRILHRRILLTLNLLLGPNPADVLKI